jgi:hypothetical protein
MAWKMRCRSSKLTVGLFSFPWQWWWQEWATRPPTCVYMRMPASCWRSPSLIRYSPTPTAFWYFLMRSLGSSRRVSGWLSTTSSNQNIRMFRTRLLYFSLRLSTTRR